MQFVHVFFFSFSIFLCMTIQKKHHCWTSYLVQNVKCKFFLYYSSVRMFICECIYWYLAALPMHFYHYRKLFCTFVVFFDHYRIKRKNKQKVETKLNENSRQWLPFLINCLFSNCLPLFHLNSILVSHRLLVWHMYKCFMQSRMQKHY